MTENDLYSDKTHDVVLLNKKQVDYLIYLIALAMGIGAGSTRRLSDTHSSIKEKFYNLK